VIEQSSLHETSNYTPKSVIGLVPRKLLWLPNPFIQCFMYPWFS